MSDSVTPLPIDTCRRTLIQAGAATALTAAAGLVPGLRTAV